MTRHDAGEVLRNAPTWNEVLALLDSADARISLVVTGGGSGAIKDCLRRPGASKHFVEASVPYSRAAVNEFLGRRIASPSVCEQTAIALATEAKQRADRLADDPTGRPVGIALTAALPTDPPRDHQQAIYVALVSEAKSETWSVMLTKGDYDRQQAENIADAMIRQAISIVCSR